MIKFNIDQFLAHFFKKNERVDVNADELQRLIRESRSKDAELKRQNALVEFLTEKVNRLENDKKAHELKREFTYSLDLSV